MSSLMKVVLLLALVLTCLSCTRPNIGDDAWETLFNGNNLDGWQVKCLPEDRDTDYWTVEGGTIKLNSLGRSDHDYVWLMTDQEYADFELRLRFQAYRDSPGNSGVQVRSRYDDGSDAPGGGWLDGPQIDIHAPEPWRTGLIYDETREERRWISPSLEDWNIDDSFAPDERRFFYEDEGDGWNELYIICSGLRITTLLNGYVMTEYDGTGVLDNDAHRLHRVGLDGFIALQLHAGDEVKMRFKDIEIRLPAEIP